MSSLSAIERANPPPRRKSCQACIKAKRRCDLGQPACLRCTQRLLECRYDATVSAARRNIAASAEKRQQAVAADRTSIPPSALTRQEEPESVEQIMTDLSSMVDPVLDAGFDFYDTDLDIMQFINDTPTQTLEDMSSCATAFTIPNPPTASYNKLDLVLQSKGDLALALQPEGKWRSTPLAFTIAHRLQYSIDLVKDAPRRMVMELQTPWCHPELYRDDMPKSMQDALSSCALYQAKNPRNSFVILHSIRTRIRDLTTTPPPSRPLEVLARVQAILLYLIILVFDGDILSRASAEAATPALESAAISLVGLFGHNPFHPSSSPSASHPPPPDSLPLYPIGPAREFWQAWVLQESARRTYMTAFFVQQLYLLLKGDTPRKCDQRLYLCHFWTVSAHLWGARDAFDFALAWRERRHFVVNNNTIKEVLSEARGDDIEDFGKMILTTLMGIDETKGWLHSRGATL
ncbi:hypothetical protein CONLIGDRAFT_632908 [Coniochaeta ligniaria NRRL 30616]|uniref:Zn(2)-C6 fungal-type domain-containing protein n=1 Tax=Coniochaeta ligniaria NRRL 30616 TaxID=1408157 RepID=A0A1J7J5T0_9PEZI|nr:hypothetical protein CONLIGDRAFT_632908 [Coniochaeta ligniaria NRRL 30616]